MAVTDIPLGDATNPDIVWLLKPDLVTKTPLVATAGGSIPVSSTPPTGAAATQVQGTAADGAPVVGAPVRVAGKDGSGNTQDIATNTSGDVSTVIQVISSALADAASNTQNIAVSPAGTSVSIRSFGLVYNNSTWDRARGDTTAAFFKQPPLPGTDRSITATTTSQQLMAANASRSKFYIKNDTLIDVYINFGATAVAAAGTGNMKIAAGAYYEFTGSNGAINIIASSTTAAITCREF